MAKAKTSITTENHSGSAADAAAKEQRTEMPLSDLHPFEGHPFKVLDDELMEQTRLEQENMNEQMLLELTQAANNLDEAQLESTIAERSLQQAEENMRVSRSQYDVGLETLSDHLEAQAMWQQAYETHVDARFRLYLNYVAYLKATGTLLK